MPLLSEDYVRRIKLPPGKASAEFRDSKLTGFWLRVRRRADGSLAKAYFVDHLVALPDGRKVRRKLAIGDSGTFHADKAREEAQRMLQAVRRGESPAAERTARKARPTFETLVGRYREKRLARRKPATQRNAEGHFRRLLLPAFGALYVDDITSSMIADMHHRYGRTAPVNANRGLATMSALMTFAVSEGMRSDNPCRHVEKFRETAKDDWLDENQLPRFIGVLGEVNNAVGELLRFLVLSGWRISEARLLEWDYVNLPLLVVHLPDSKAGAITRPLSADAAALIDRQTHRTGFVFSGTHGRRPLHYPRIRRVLAAVCERAGVTVITPHALRHTAATHSALAGATVHELRELGGWKTLAMASRYVSRAESLGRSAAEKLAGRVNILGKAKAPKCGR